MPAKRDPDLMATRPDFATRVMVVLAWLVTAATLIVPLAAAPDLLDRFRILKEAITRAEGILGLFLIVVATALGNADRIREMLRARAVVAIVIAGVVWTAVMTVTSSHRPSSIESLVSVITSVLVFMTVWYAAPRLSLTILDVLVPAVLINTVFAALQEYGLYQPFYIDPLSYRHLSATALIGNPNIVGSYMALAAIPLATAAVRIHGWRRWWYTFGAFCAVSGVFVSRTTTAVIALMVGLAVLAFTLAARRALAFALLLVLLFGIGHLSDMRVILRLVALPERIATEGWEVASSGRMTPALVALQMVRDHPVTGVGPGAYQFQYMSYQVRVRQQYGGRVRGVGATSFGEAHNDHLQLLAETGLPGYLLFLGTLGILIRTARRTAPTDERHGIARTMALPLAAAFAVLCLAQFPLHVAVTRQLLMTIAGLLVGWSRR